MDVQESWSLQRLQGSTLPSRKRCQPIGIINPCVKARGKPDAVNPHVRFDVAGVGNVARLRQWGTREAKPRANGQRKPQPRLARQSSTLPERGYGRPTVERPYGARSLLYSRGPVLPPVPIQKKGEFSSASRTFLFSPQGPYAIMALQAQFRNTAIP